MIYTSYFARVLSLPDFLKSSCVSIARATPKGLSCKGMRTYTNLVPSWDLIMDYKRSGDKEKYIREYNKQLSFLDVDKVARDLDGKTLLCYERSTEFCHRHLVASWLNNHGYVCEEYIKCFIPQIDLRKLGVGRLV